MPKHPSIGSLALPHVAAMRGYVPGMQPAEAGWIKLNTNENAYPPSPRVVEAIERELVDQARGLRLYPNPTSAPLRRAIAAHHNVEESCVLAGNGCDDILNLLMRVFCGAKRAAGMMVPSYTLYATLCCIQGASLKEVPFDRSMELPIDAIASCGANLFFLTSPHAPTGVGFSPKIVAELMERFPGILVVDETYAPFAGEDCVGLLADHPRLVITRSFSKAYALAGLRVGYALAHPEVIGLLDRVRDSYNLDRIAQAAATAAIADQEYHLAVIAKILAQRKLAAADYERRGWFAFASAANFHFVEPVNAQGEANAETAQDLFEFLTGRKILVRSFPNHALTQRFLRISVGGVEEMTCLAQTLDQWQRN